MTIKLSQYFIDKYWEDLICIDHHWSFWEVFLINFWSGESWYWESKISKMGDSDSGIGVGTGTGSKFYQFGAGIGIAIRMPRWNRNRSRSRDHPEPPIFAKYAIWCVLTSLLDPVFAWETDSCESVVSQPFICSAHALNTLSAFLRSWWRQTDGNYWCLAKAWSSYQNEQCSSASINQGLDVATVFYLRILWSTWSTGPCGLGVPMWLIQRI